MTKPLMKLTGIALVAAAAQTAMAGPLDRSVVAKDATWVVHVDVEAGLGSTVGRFALANRDKLQMADLERVKAETGIDPFGDIKGVTVYGLSCDAHDGVAVIFTTPAVDGLIQKLKGKEKSFDTIKEGPYTIYSWSEQGENRYGLIRPGKGPGDRVVLVAADKARLIEGARIAEGKSPALEKGAAGLLGRSPKGGSIIFAAASQLSGAEAMPFEKMKGLLLDIGEGEGQMYADLTVEPQQAADANDLLGILQGSMAFVRMAARNDPEMGELAKLADGLSFAAKDGQVTAHLRVKTDDIVHALTEMNGKEGGKVRKDRRAAPAEKPAKNEDDDGDKR